MLMQESSYEISATGLQCEVSEFNGKECVAIDFGIGQINHRTIKSFKFDQDRLLSDLEYSVEAAAIVLADFKRMYGSREEDYWSRYNSGVKSKREAYKVLVARYM